MFISEITPEEYKTIYCKLSGGYWNEKTPKYNNWFVDYQNYIYINRSGKRGAETPVFFNMYYQNCVIEFGIWDYDEHDNHVYVTIPESKKYQKSEIESIIRTAHKETNCFDNGYSRVNDINNCGFKWNYK